MRHLPIYLVLAVFLVFTPAARAVIVGTIPSTQVLDFMSSKENSYDLFSLKGSSLTNLNTTIQQTNGSRVWGIGNTVYFNDTAGLYSQAIGSSTAKQIKAQKSLEGQLMLGKNWLISNQGTSGGGQSFFFNVQTKKVTKFTPVVKMIVTADATANKSTMVMIAKNGQGKQKLFLSTSSISQVREFPLPSHAKSCDGLSIAPQGKTVVVGCTFTVAGKKTTQDGYAAYTRSGNDLKLVTKTINDDSIGGFVWLDDQQAVVLADMKSGSIEVRKWTIAKGKITRNVKLLSNGTSEVSGQAVSYSPFQILNWTKNKFYYNMMYVYAANPDIFLTFIDSYDLSTGESDVVADNNDFQVIF